MKYFIFICCALLVNACSLYAGEITDRADIFGNELILKTENGISYLYTNGPYGKKKIKLLTTPPCYFARKSGGSVQYFIYEEKNVDAVLIVIGGLINEDIKKEYNLPEDFVCGKEAQGIFLKNKEISVSNRKGTGAIKCRNIELDKIFFSDFVYYPNSPQ